MNIPCSIVTQTQGFPTHKHTHTHTHLAAPSIPPPPPPQHPQGGVSAPREVPPGRPDTERCVQEPRIMGLITVAQDPRRWRGVELTLYNIYIYIYAMVNWYVVGVCTYIRELWVDIYH